MRDYFKWGVFSIESTSQLVFNLYVFVVVSLSLWGGYRVEASYVDLMGYPALQAYVLNAGVELPTGLGVPVIQVEAELNPGSGRYRPRETNSTYAGKTFRFLSGDAGSMVSSHADRIGFNLYSNGLTFAPGVGVPVAGMDHVDIEVMRSNQWVNGHFLKPAGSMKPLVSDNRIANHSWVDNGGSMTSTVVSTLERVDWLVEHDEFIQVVGTNNSNPARDMLAGSYNSIAVGMSTGWHASGTNALDSYYVEGRTKPDVVSIGLRHDDDNYRTSWATAQVSSAVALLISSSQNSGLGVSHGFHYPERVLDYNPDIAPVYHADTPEVIKATLMAGADRRTHNKRDRPDGNPGGVSMVEIYNYREDPLNQTENGLDNRFGAGQVDVYQSYLIQQAGEQDSLEDGGEELTAPYGWDYDASFGGGFDFETLRFANYTATYRFTASPGRNQLSATLAWHFDISDGVGDFFGTPVALRDLDLYLIDVTNGDEVVVGASESSIDNTETLWMKLENNHEYEIRVKPKAGQFGFVFDYGLAWRMTPDIGDFNHDGLIGPEDVDLLARGIMDGDIHFDVNGDGDVDDDDYAYMIDEVVRTVHGDINLDGVADLLDLALMATYFSDTGGWADGDLNGDEMIDLEDLAIFADSFGSGATAGDPVAVMGGAVSIPEPGMLGLMGVICVVGLGRRESV